MDRDGFWEMADDGLVNRVYATDAGCRNIKDDLFGLYAVLVGTLNEAFT